MPIIRTHKKNPQKSSTKVTINSFMMGSLFVVLSLIFSLNPENFSHYIIYQLVLAIPLLYVASLAYSKIGYWNDVLHWNSLGWITNTTGNLFVINAVGLLAAKYDPGLAYLYFFIFGSLMVVYTAINIRYSDSRYLRKFLKLSYLLLIITALGILAIK